MGVNENARWRIDNFRSSIFYLSSFSRERPECQFGLVRRDRVKRPHVGIVKTYLMLWDSRKFADFLQSAMLELREKPASIRGFDSFAAGIPVSGQEAFDFFRQGENRDPEYFREPLSFCSACVQVLLKNDVRTIALAEPVAHSRKPRPSRWSGRATHPNCSDSFCRLKETMPTLSHAPDVIDQILERMGQLHASPTVAQKVVAIDAESRIRNRRRRRVSGTRPGACRAGF